MAKLDPSVSRCPTSTAAAITPGLRDALARSHIHLPAKGDWTGSFTTSRNKDGSTTSPLHRPGFDWQLGFGRDDLL